MDAEGDSQPTQQATQDVLDPRRLGKQNSGFTDEEIADIICLLIPTSDTARRETSRIAKDSSSALIARHDERAVEDGGAELFSHSSGQQEAIVLRLSTDVKNPAHGFTFGRNPNRCDVCFLDDPYRRLSNVHFRIYLNHYGVLMLEDMSTNGTVVDETLLKARAAKPLPQGTKRTLSSGTTIKIVMHDEASDLEFLVRVPRRGADHERAYRNNLTDYTHRIARRLGHDVGRTIVPGPGGHVDIFGTGPGQGADNAAQVVAVKAFHAALEEPLPVSWDKSGRYNRVGEIGKGAFATVYKLTSAYDGLPYAAKEIDRRKFMKNGVMDQKVENEMIIMQRIKHDHIVRYIEHIDWDDRLLVIIMDYVPGGDLGRLISDRGALPHEDVQLISRQMLSALAYLHENNITHRDVKPDNILIESYRPSLFVKLTDFGLSKIVDNEQTFLRTFCGTLLYCAPEVYSEYNEYDEYGRRLGRQALARSRRVRKRYDHAVDVWSLGGVLFYALSGSPPYPARNGISHSELLHQIMTTRLNIVPLTQAKVSGEGIDFLTQMLERRPDKRASMKDLLQHRWAGGNGMPATTVPQSDDEVSDEEQVLQVRASQLSLEDKERLLFAGQLDPLAALYDVDEEESIEDSQKENYTFCPQDPPGGRLFGEVDINLSAIGPSGAIPANRLNLPVSIASSGIIGDMVSEVADSYETQTRIISRPDSDRRSNNGGASLSLSASHGGHSRSIDQLNNATFDESSQDLGGAESILEALNMKSLGGSHLREFRDSELNTSKRRAESDGSDSREQLAPRDKPIFKRLKSETMLEPGPEIEEHELPLFARMPSATRHIASRVIDSPVHKATFWSSSDKSTWHLRYPEMTQLQLDAFNAACQGSGEAFQPGASPLWDLACKYFPPTYAGEEDEGGPSQDSPTLGRTVSSMTVPAPGPDEEEVVPSTPLPGDMSSLPDTLPPDASFSGRRSEPPPRFRRVVATLRSVPSPGVEDIGISMAEPMLSWGRAPQNTRVFPNSKEDRIPKFAFRIMLWAEDYSPVRNMHPWARSPTRQREAAFAFYVSTMATYGIRVNGFPVSSRESRYSDQHPGNWLRLYDGDQIEIWRAKDSNARIALTFRCNWSGSTQPRPAAPPDSLFGSPPSQLLPALEPEATARKIAEAYLRAEKRLRDPKTKDERMEEADFDMDLRLDNVERERYQSQLFERKRIAACRMLRAPANRRHSPASKGVAGAARTSGTDSVNGNGNGDDGRIGNLVLGMGDTLGGRFKVASSGRS